MTISVVLKRHHRSDADRFLADVKMAKTADLTHSVNLGALFLEPAAEDHLVKHLAEKLFVGLLDRCELGVSAFQILRLGLFNHGKIYISIGPGFFP